MKEVTGGNFSHKHKCGYTTEDQEFFTGSGTGQPKGISQETITSQVASASPAMNDIIDLIDLVPQRVTQSPKAALNNLLQQD